VESQDRVHRMESAVQHAWLKEVLKVVPALWKARAFLVEKNAVKVDAISAQQLHVLKQHHGGKVRLTDVKELFLRMKDQI
jgi:hypothetical protein